MRVHTPKHMNRVVALVAAALLVVAALAGAAPQRALAKGLEAGKEVGTETERTDVVEINSIADLFREIVLSRESDDAGGDFSNKKLVLTTDIDLTDTSTKDFNDAIIKELGSLTFGTIDHPFTGEFDGQGHTIIGLDYRRDLFVPKANTGLFAATDGAYIHDINFRDGYIGADYRGGYIVGYSKNTTIEGVHIINCTPSRSSPTRAWRAAWSWASARAASSTTARFRAAAWSAAPRRPYRAWAARASTWAPLPAPPITAP